jgi:hypothetical protein
MSGTVQAIPSLWLTAEEAQQQLGVSYSLLRLWATQGCCYLNGKAVRTHAADCGFLYDRRDIERIAATPSPYEREAPWLPLAQAVAEYGFTRDELYNWRRKGCPFLGGKRVRSRRVALRRPGQVGRARVRVFYRADLEAILEAQAAGGSPSDTSGDWLSVTEAAEFLGCTPSSIYQWAAKGCPALDGKKLYVQTKTVVMRDGRTRPVAEYNRAELEEIKQARATSRHGTPGSDWISGQEAVDLFGLDLNRLYEWHKKGCALLGGTKLGARRIKAGSGALVRKVWHFNREQIKEIAAALRAGFLDAGVQDKEGTWLSAAVAKKRYGILIQQLERWRQQPCPYLGGNTIRHKQVPCAAMGVRRGGVLWIYLEDDLRRIADAKKKDAPAVYKDAEGVWLFASEVTHRFGIRADNLWHYRATTYSFLAAGKIRAKQVDATHHPRPPRTRGRLWVYFEDDMKRVAAHLAGKPIPPAAPPPATSLPPEPPKKKRRGRPSGHTADWLERQQAMLKDWDSRKYKTKKEAGEAHGFDRTEATKIINAHEDAKRGNNSPR